MEFRFPRKLSAFYETFHASLYNGGLLTMQLKLPIGETAVSSVWDFGFMYVKLFVFL